MTRSQLLRRVCSLEERAPAALDDAWTLAGLAALEAAGELTRGAGGVFAGETPPAARIAALLNLAAARRAQLENLETLDHDRQHP